MAETTLGRLRRRGLLLVHWTVTLQLPQRLAEVMDRRRALAGRPPTRLGEWRRVIAQVRAEFLARHGRPPALLRPRRFTDKMQWRKLFELEPVFAILSDKLAARDYVTARLGPGHQAPLLWSGSDPDGIPFERLVPPYALKSAHACAQVILVRAGETPDHEAMRVAARGWLAHCHGAAHAEPGYMHVPRRLLVEGLLLDRDGAAPIERRVFVHGGRVAFIQTTLMAEPGGPRSAGFHDRDWNFLPIWLRSRPDRVSPPRPAQLAEMIAVSERLGAGLSHCRVDLYDCGDSLRVGEITLYSWSGYYPFQDLAYDEQMGRDWPMRFPLLRAAWTVATRRWEIRPPLAD